jgi:hypothetical protein
VINDHTIADFESTAAGAGLDYLPAWFVAGDHPLISLRPLAKMLAIDSAYIRATNRRSFDRNQDFTMSWFWYRDTSHLDGTVPRQERRSHSL